MRPESTPWFGAALRTTEQARQACDLVARLSSAQLPMLRPPGAAGPRGDRAAAAARLPDEVAAHAAVRGGRRRRCATLDAGGVRGRPGPARGRACGDGAGLSFRERRALRKQARALAAGPAAPPSRGGAGRGARARPPASWPSGGSCAPTTACRGSRPRYRRAGRAWRASATRSWAALRGYHPAARRTPSRSSPRWPPIRTPRGSCPGCTSWAPGSTELGLGPLLDELARREADAGPGRGRVRPRLVLRRSWTRSGSATRATRRTAAAALDEIASDFRVRDVQHLSANRAGSAAPGRSGCARPRTGTRCRPGSSASRPRCAAATCRCAGCSTRPATCCSRSSRAGPCHR